MCQLILHMFRGPLPTRESLILENVALRHQLQVLTHPTIEWATRRLVAAFPWDTAPTLILQDRDRTYGRAFTAMVEAMGIQDPPTAPRWPRQNPYIERLIGTLRRDRLDHVIVSNERRLHRVLAEYVAYYNESRTHLGLDKECPVPRAVEPPGIGPLQKS